MQRLVITGSSGALGQRLVALLAEEEAETGHQLFDEIIAVDRLPLPVSTLRPSGVRAFVRDLSASDTEGLVELFSDVDVLVHLATDGTDIDNPIKDVDQTRAKRVFDAAAEAHVGHVVVVSSAVVYGAWPDNPVPMTEAAPIRVNPGFAFAEGRVLLEQQATDWATQTRRTVTILRPCVSPLATGTSGWLAKAVRPSRLDQLIAPLPAVQFVHVDDVASAVLHASVERLDGVFNVAPDGWLTGEEVPALLGTILSIPATGRFHDIASAGARLVVRSRRRPEGAKPWSVQPWVIANDRLKATGWAPRSTSAEVIVASRRPSKIAALFARKRQEATIAAVGTVSVGVLGFAFSAWRRFRSRR